MRLLLDMRIFWDAEENLGRDDSIYDIIEAWSREKWHISDVNFQWFQRKSDLSRRIGTAG
jgi:uncharacterized protein YdaU (DUF1376 family)